MTIGDRLKKEREKKGLTLDDVHTHLRIHQNILACLEKNDFQSLPAAIYTKGFLKRYGGFLNINVDELLSEYDSLKIKERVLSLQVGLKGNQRVPDPITQPTLAPAKEPLKNMPPVGKRQSSRSPYFSFAALKWIIILAASALAIFLSMKCYHFFAAWASSVPAKQAAKKRPINSASTIPFAATQIAGVGSGYIHSPQQGNFPRLSSKTPLNLSVTANTDAWMRVSSDGNVAFEAVMRPGQTKEWTAQKTFELKLGRPAGVSLSLNGYSMGSPDGGQAKQVQITHEGMVRLK